MNIKIIELSAADKALSKFIKLPKSLYSFAEYTQNDREVEQILKGIHPLSHYFQIYPLLAVDEKGKALGRLVLTVYPKDLAGYLGFYECVDEREVSLKLLQYAEELAKKLGCNRLLGPVDASFWLGYRFKVNQFGRPYTGEPYNKSYYADQWQQAGFERSETYYSNHYPVLCKEDGAEIYPRRLKAMKEAGYVFTHPTAENFDKALEEVYEQLIVLYQNFPAYKHITKEEFCGQFSYLNSILCYEMVKLCYFEEKLVGFFVSIPDYGSLAYGKLTPFKLLRILQKRRKPSGYVMLYMGVDRAHRGLGRALAQATKEELVKQQTPSFGALIHAGNFTQGFFKEQVDMVYEYILLEKPLP